MDVKFPKIKVKLVGSDGNAFAIIGKVAQAMRKGGCSNDDIVAFRTEAMSGDYNNVLCTAMRYVEVS